MKILKLLERFFILTITSMIAFSFALYLFGVDVNNYSEYQLTINTTMYGMISAIIVIYMMDHKN